MMHYRVKYLDNGEWVRSGLMTRANAEKIAKQLLMSYENVEVYEDDNY